MHPHQMKAFLCVSGAATLATLSPVTPSRAQETLVEETTSSTTSAATGAAALSPGVLLGSLLALGVMAGASEGGDGSNDTDTPEPSPTPEPEPAPLPEPEPEPAPEPEPEPAPEPEPEPAPEPEPEPAPAPEPEPNQPREFYETGEYLNTNGLEAINAAARYADGATGDGVVVSIFDSGIDVDHPEFAGRVLLDQSYGYFTDDTDVTDFNGHGTHVAGTIAAARDGGSTGTHGVAFESQLMIFQGVERDVGDTLTVDLNDALADATNRSVEGGAIAMNHSWGLQYIWGATVTIGDVVNRADLENFLGGTLISAFNNANANGLVNVWASGNTSETEVGIYGGVPVYMPEYADHWLVVGALDANDQIASFSNRCGMAQDICLVAPGVDVNSTYLEGQYARASGTSMAAPHVTGSIALLKSNFPELTSAQVVQILKDTARDLGAAGVDAVYGHGALDLENAVAPQGTLTIEMAENLGIQTHNAQDTNIIGGAAAPALAAALSGETMMLTDIYARGYDADMGVFVDETNMTRLSAVKRFVTGKSAMRLTSVNTTLALSIGSLDALGSNGWVRGVAIAHPYASLIEDGAAFNIRHQTDNGLLFGLSAASETSSTDETAHYVSGEVGAQIGKAGISLSFGQMNERGGFLGTQTAGAFGQDMRAVTEFARIGASFPMGDGMRLHLSAAQGDTQFSSSGILTQGQDITSETIGLGVSHRDLWTTGDRLTLAAHRPVSARAGQITMHRPTARAAADGSKPSSGVELGTTSVEIEQTYVPTEFQIGYTTPAFGGNASIGASWVPELQDAPSVALGLTFQF